MPRIPLLTEATMTPEQKRVHDFVKGRSRTDSLSVLLHVQAVLTLIKPGLALSEVCLPKHHS